MFNFPCFSMHELFETGNKGFIYLKYFPNQIQRKGYSDSPYANFIFDNNVFMKKVKQQTDMLPNIIS